MAFHHAGQVEVGESNQSRAVHVDDPKFTFKITRAELAVGADTRIVDQEVNRYASLFSESEDFCSRVGLRKIGGGLLGLEAARGLQVRGCDVTVIHLMDSLMERQLDATGGEYLKRRIEDRKSTRLNS